MPNRQGLSSRDEGSVHDPSLGSRDDRNELASSIVALEGRFKTDWLVKPSRAPGGYLKNRYLMTAAMAQTSNTAAARQPSTTIHIMMSGILTLPQRVQSAAGLSFAIGWQSSN